MHLYISLFKIDIFTFIMLTIIMPVFTWACHSEKLVQKKSRGSM